MYLTTWIARAIDHILPSDEQLATERAEIFRNAVVRTVVNGNVYVTPYSAYPPKPGSRHYPESASSRTKN